ncbi:MAG: hypothetical protein QOD74_2203 [Variibacter sp.]|jgi:8-oxo-dGTP pyrophosphatase MutT (NUDIX family)|nr:hypothetical protein [Variibacter sp.]
MSATEWAERLTKVERDQTFDASRPRDAATLIVLDQAGPEPTVLMGRRHAGQKFMPGKFVFPGGRVESYDGRMQVAGSLPSVDEERLLKRIQRPSAAKARAFALAAIRETCEETGVVLGRRTEAEPQIPSEDWRHFAQARVVPDLGSVRFIARAITPPRRPRRFDARFFVADATTIVHRLEGVVGPDSEFVEVAWVPLSQARSFDLPTITQIVLEELQRRIAEGLDRDRPVPFYHTKQGKFMRELL